MTTNPRAHLDAENTSVVIEHVSVRDADVVREAQRWTTGERGGIVDDPDVLAEANLSAFVVEAVKIGAHALSATGRSQEAADMERLVKELGEKTAITSEQAVELTARTVKDASKTVTKAADDAKKALLEADQQSRREFTKSVAAAKEEVNGEIRRLLGGENPELLERLQPVLDKFGEKLDAKSTQRIDDLVTKTVKQFDPADPTSPMAKYTAAMEARQEELTELISGNHESITKKVDELSTALKVQDARAKLAKVTPIKGDTYENQVNALLFAVAAGLGDEYTDTRNTVGSLPRCKKGDGLLTVDGGVARVVIEMTDSARAGWSDYFDAAERNRDAAASLGLVRSPDQNGGQIIRVLGSRRVVLAYDPLIDDPDLVRTAILLLRTAALAASSRQGAEQLATAEEKITEAMEQLNSLDVIKNAAGLIHKHATKIESGCTTVNSTINRLLTDALAALAEAHVETDTAGEEPSDGAVA